MKKRRWTWVLVTLACCLSVAPTTWAQGVKVNGKEIPGSYIDAMAKNQLAQSRPEAPPNPAELRNAIKNELISRELLAQEAQKKGLAKDPEAAIVLENARRDILAQLYVRDYFRANPITDDLVKTEYERLKSQLPSKEFKIHHIQVEKEEEARTLIAQIKKGTAFEKLAAEKSKDPGSKDKGGEVGWSTFANLKPLADAVAKLKKGQLAETPVQTQHGWHVVRLDDEQPTKIPGFEESKAQVQQIVQQQIMQKVLADLRAKAKIE